MNLRIRRTLVIGGVVASLVVGVVSIRVAARLAEAAAPPPAPPVSIATLTSELEAERARAGDLQRQLDELVDATGQLTAALDATGDQVSLDGLSADQLRDRLVAAEAKLASVSKLLSDAQKRLAALQAAAKQPATGSGGTGSSGGGTTSGSGAAAPTPTPRPTATPRSGGSALTLSVAVAAGGIEATWSTCTVSGFNSYALVRSTDNEIHYPPEDRDTLVARITDVGQTSLLDTGASSGSAWYRLYCLVSQSGELKVSASSPTQQITVP
jgi:hypothetical protein